MDTVIHHQNTEKIWRANAQEGMASSSADTLAATGHFFVGCDRLLDVNLSAVVGQSFF
jgi:hypothetical protein